MRRRCVFSRRTSPNRWNKTDARTSSQRSRLFSGLAIVIFPAESNTHGERTRREPKDCAKRRFSIVAQVIFLAEVTMQAGKIPTTADKLDRAPRWQRGFGNFLARPGRPDGKNAHELRALEPRAVSGPWPAIFARLYFFIHAARRSVVAILLSDHATGAARPLFSLRRNRSIAERRHQRRRRNRTSARVYRPSSVICSAELATRERNANMRETAQPGAAGGPSPLLYDRWQFSSWSHANQWRRNNWATLLSRQCRLWYLLADIHVSGGRA